MNPCQAATVMLIWAYNMKRKTKTLFKNQSGIAHISLIIILISSLFVGMAGYAYTRISSASTPLTNINVGTYNIRGQRWDGFNSTYASWATRAPRVKSMIANNPAGIIGMQEVFKHNPDTNKYISQRNDVINFMTAMDYGYFVGSVDNTTPIFWKKGNFTKLTTGETKIYDISSGSGTRPPATRYLSFVRLQQIHHRKNILVFNYHFNNQSGATIDDRQASVIASRIKAIRGAYPNDDIFFTGDFNNRHGKVMYALEERGVKLRLADSNGGVDHVLKSSAVSVRDWYSTGKGNPYASDHPMIIAKLTI